mgnify:CR=1 FL=1
MTTRIGIDIGGTFTDFALFDDRRRDIVTHKRLTTPGEPERKRRARSKRLQSMKRKNRIFEGRTVWL